MDSVSEIAAHHKNPRRWTLKRVELDDGRVLRRSEAKRRAVIEAARAVVTASGYAGATMERIAKQARVGKQTLYRWWPTKASLYVDCYADLVSPKAIAADSLDGLLKRLFHLYRTSEAGDILAGLIGDAANNEDARSAVSDGLVLGRWDIIAKTLDEEQADIDTVQEIVIGQVWRTLILDPARLDDAYAERLAAQALAAGKTQ